MSSVTDRTFVAQIANPEELAFVDFDDERAVIDVPGAMLGFMPFEVQEPVDNAAVRDEIERIRAFGYKSAEPITLEPRPGGRWAVDDHDATRFLAARKVAGELMSNLFSRKVPNVRFVLLATSYDGKFRAARKPLNYGAH
jgi:hypothetical protein